MHVSQAIPATLARIDVTDPRTAPGKSFKPSADWRAKWLRLDEAAHPEVARLALAAEQFAKRLANNDRSGPRLLVLGGRNGVGKTHVARAIHRYFNAVALDCVTRGNWRCESVPHSVFSEWAELAECEPGRSAPAWDTATGADVLVLDDVGADVDRFKSGLPVANLARMLNARERRWTVVTMNHPPSAWVDRFDKRVADRLHRHAHAAQRPAVHDRRPDPDSAPLDRTRRPPQLAPIRGDVS